MTRQVFVGGVPLLLGFPVDLVPLSLQLDPTNKKYRHLHTANYDIHVCSLLSYTQSMVYEISSDNIICLWLR